MFSNQVDYEELRSIDSSTFTGDYQAIGGPLLNPAVLVKIVNNSTSLVTVSLDGSTDHDVVPGQSFTLYDYATNRSNKSSTFAVPVGTQYYVSGSVGTGSVYLVVQYAFN